MVQERITENKKGKNVMMTNESLAEFEKENEYPFYMTTYVSYPE